MSTRHPIPTLAGILVLAVALVTASCGGSSTSTADPTRPADGAQDVAQAQDVATPLDGAQLYQAACAVCHGPLGEGGLSGVPLNEASAADRQLVIGAIRNGVGGMPASSDGMSDEQIKALAEYVAGLR